MILIVGGTGRLGRLLVDGLLARGESVRVLTRDAGRAAGTGADVVVGDLCDPDAVTRAVAGCTAVIAAAHGYEGGRGAGPAEVDGAGNRSLIRAAAAAGVERFVLMSVPNVSADHRMALHRMKFAAEEELRASGMAFTILRSASFFETWIDVLGAKVSSGGLAMVFGRGANPINFVSVLNVRDVVLAAVSDPGMRNQVYDVFGPANLTMREFAQRLAAGAGGQVKAVPRPVLRMTSVLARPIKPVFARQAHDGVVLDTADMSGDFEAAVRRLPAGIRWHTLDDVLRDRSASVSGA